MSDFWNDKYRSEDWFYGKEPNDFLKQNYSKFSSEGRILSLGEGEGRNAIFLLKNGFSVDAIDLSEVGLNKLEAEANKLNLSTQLKTTVGDFQDIPLRPKHYDAVVSIWCHGDFEMRSNLYFLAKRALKPGGLFLLEGYTPRQVEFKTGGPPDPELMYTEKEIEEAFSGKEKLLLQEIERDVQEGSAHNGLSHVAQALIRN